MVASAMVLNSHLIHDGETFLWWVVDGEPSTVMVSHPTRGTRTCPIDGDPAQTARELAKDILAASD